MKSIKERGWDQMAVIAEILKVKYKIDSISCLNRKGKTAQKSLTTPEG